MSRGQMLRGQMSPWQLEYVLNVHRNLSLKFHQNWVSCSWDIPDMAKYHEDKCCLDKCHHKAEIRLRLGRNRTPIYKFRFRLGRNRNLITNFGLNRIFRPKLWKERHRDQTWKKVLMRWNYLCTFFRIVEISGLWKIIFSYFGIKPYKLWKFLLKY